MQAQVVLAVVEVVADAMAYLYLILRGDCNIAGVEQAMDVGAQEESVSDIVLGTPL